MAFLRWIPMLTCTLALAQEPFPEERPSPWVPRWELDSRMERIAGILGDGRIPMGDIQRAGVQLRLRWSAEWAGLEWVGGIRSAVGSDGNSNNIPRWDQQPSNGTQLDMAHADLTGLSATFFGRVRVGFQDLNLITSQAVWDPDLRFLGVGAGGGWRSGIVREAGLRAARGRVRTVYGGSDLDLGVLQAVLKLESGPFAWTFHADRWDLGWIADEGRFQAPDFRSTGHQVLILDGIGGSAVWEGALPLEVRWNGYREHRTRETSEEFQVIAGNRVRPWRPQASFTWQRLSSTGCLYPLNSDQWWYYRGAKGPRYEVVLPLPRSWSVSLTYLRQSIRSTSMVAAKTILGVKRNF